MAGSQQNSKGRKAETPLGKGKVTPPQVAFIVYRYLSDNNFSSTSSVFRNEASSLISNSPIHQAPKSLLTLGEMLDEYISLKEQKVMLEQERVLMEKEKNRVQMLLQGMQNAMNAYNASGNPPAAAAKPAVAPMVRQPIFINKSQPGVAASMQNKFNTHPLPVFRNTNAEGGNFSTPMNLCDRKRKDTKAVDAPSAVKKPRSKSSSKKVPIQGSGQNAPQQPHNAINNQAVAQPSSAIQSSPQNCIPSGLQAQGSNVQPSVSVPVNSQVPKTPRRATSSHSDTHISPPEISSAATRNCEATTTCCTVISTKRVMVSPAKQMAYIEMSHCISPVKTGSDKASKRDHVRSRLDFDASDNMPESSDKPLLSEVSTSESEKEFDMFDIETDFLNFDALGMDFSFTDMLNDLEIPCEGIDFPSTSSPSLENASGSPQECNESNALPEVSTFAEFLCGKDLKVLGSDCMTAMKSVTKSITVISPEKNSQRTMVTGSGNL